MGLSKMKKGALWIINHLVGCLVVTYFIAIFTLSIWSHFCVDFDFNKMLKANEPIIDLFISSLGIGGAMVLYSKYLTKKQHEAVFGFYANMRVFLKRLDVFLGNNFSESTIIVKLYTRSALRDNSCSVPSEECMSAFRNLCCEFLSFLSDSKDNIPAQRGSEDFVKWFESQIRIVEFLQKGTLFSDSYYGDCPNKEELETFYNQITEDVKYINNAISKKVMSDSFKS